MRCAGLRVLAVPMLSFNVLFCRTCQPPHLLGVVSMKPSKYRSRTHLRFWCCAVLGLVLLVSGLLRARVLRHSSSWRMKNLTACSGHAANKQLKYIHHDRAT